MMSSPLLAIFFAIGALVFDQTEGQGVFELRMSEISPFNFEGGDVAKNSITLRVCLKHFESQIDVGGDCTFGETTISLDAASAAQADPVQVPMPFGWPGKFSLILEAHGLPAHSDDKTSTMLMRTVTQDRLTSGSSWQHGSIDSQTSDVMDMQFQYRVRCSASYYGPHCSTLCRPRDDPFGHYTCDPVDGSKICLPGWQRDSSERLDAGYCTKAICASGCDGSNGFCDLPGQCKCKTGWQGAKCDQCVRYPGCVHGTCQAPHECKCRPGWGGLFCDQDRDSCSNKSPCKNGGTCRNGAPGTYTCSCPDGFEGKNCESRSVDSKKRRCEREICLNGGTCIMPTDGQKTCLCPVGFGGARCEQKLATCVDSPCLNRATCYQRPAVRHSVETDQLSQLFRRRRRSEQMPSDKSRPAYMCSCRPGFTGINCETEQIRSAPLSTLKSRDEEERLTASQIVVIALIGFALPLTLISLASALLWCRRERRRREQIQCDADAERENELNSVHCVSAKRITSTTALSGAGVGDSAAKQTVSMLYHPAKADLVILPADAKRCCTLDDEEGSTVSSSVASSTSSHTSSSSAAHHSRLSQLSAQSLAATRRIQYHMQWQQQQQRPLSMAGGLSNHVSCSQSVHHDKARDLPTAASIQIERNESRGDYHSVSFLKPHHSTPPSIASSPARPVQAEKASSVVSSTNSTTGASASKSRRRTDLFATEV